MAITDANVSWIGNAPTVADEVLAISGLSGDAARTLVGTVTFIGDAGASTSAVLNWVDGSVVLPFTPSGALIFRNGGTAAVTVKVLSLSSITTAHATATFSAQLGNGLTGVFTIVIFK